MSYQLRLQSRNESGQDLQHLVFEADQALIESYTAPGQFLVLEVPDDAGEIKKGFFAIASPPGGANGSRIELLIKNAGDPASRICSAEIGTAFSCGPAQGNGFPVPARSADRIHLFSMGSGLAPLRALLLHELQTNAKKNGDTALSRYCLWQGSFTRAHLPFADEYEGWEAAGLELHRCLDEDDALSDAVPGNVVERLRDTAPDLRGSAAFWIGSRDFGQALIETTGELGLPAEALLSNY